MTPASTVAPAVQAAYDLARERFAAQGVDTETALAFLTRVLKMPTIAKTWSEIADQAHDLGWSHEQYLAPPRDPEFKGLVRDRDHTVVGFVERGLNQGRVEALPLEPGVVGADPGLPARVDDPVAQQELRQPMSGSHQVGAAVLAGADHVAGSFVELVGDGDRRVRIQPQQR